MRKPENALPKLATEKLAAEGQARLSGRRYKDAVEAYKLLLKRESRQEWRDALGEAYLGRAGDLAAKGMYKEAAALWENMHGVCGQTWRMGAYLSWLLQAGQYAKVGKQYAALCATAKGEKEAAVSGVLAAALLAGNRDLLEALPSDHDLLQGLASAEAALSAYCHGDEAGLQASLRGIPFRSPFRDFRQILKALSARSADPLSAGSLLDHVPTESPFAGLARVARAAVSSDGAAADALAEMGPSEQAVLAALKGWDADRLRAWKELKPALASRRPGALFDSLMAHRKLLGEDHVQRACLALIPSHPKGLRTYSQVFGPLSAFEEKRLLALAEERDGATSRAEERWRECVALLEAEPADHNRLAAALILRHIADRSEGPGWMDDEDPRIRDLEASLRLDPDDRPTYLRLATLHKEARDRNGYHECVDRALRRFPEDRDVLLLAIAAATERKAFKKAAGYARTLLDLDPINTRARQTLIASRLAHARKLMGGGKLDLARRELEQAKGLEREGARSGVIQIHLGILELLAGREVQARDWLRDGVKLAGGGPAARARVHIEAQRCKVDPQRVWKACGPAESRTPTAQEVMGLVKVIDSYADEEPKVLRGAVDESAGPLKRLAHLPYSEDEMAAILRCLYRVGHHGLLADYANQALKRWAGQPEFVFYQVVGRAEGKAHRMSDRDLDRLEAAFDEAQRARNRRVAKLIGEFLDTMINPFMLPASRGESILERAVEEVIERLGPGGLAEILEGAPSEPRPANPQPRRRKPKSGRRGGSGSDPAQGDLF
jgi:tetratricopeptide (TPR) repeat protein